MTTGADVDLNTLFGPCMNINFSINITSPISITQQPLSNILQSCPALLTLFKSIAAMRAIHVNSPEVVIETAPQPSVYRTSVTRNDFKECRIESIKFPLGMDPAEQTHLKNRLSGPLSSVTPRYISEHHEDKWDEHYDLAMSCQTRAELDAISVGMRNWYQKTKDQFRHAQLGYLRMERFIVLPAFVSDTQRFAISRSWRANWELARIDYSTKPKFSLNTASYNWLSNQMHLLLVGAICMTSRKITDLLKIRVFRKELYRRLTL